MKDLSIILIDWSVRERFHAVEWLSQQSVSRDRYELIWVELRDRVVPQVAERVDHLLTLNNTEPLYHKHKAINAGLAKASGRIVTMCDSDAVFPPDFVESVIEAFGERKVLMHQERRFGIAYPDGASIEQIKAMPFPGAVPNTSACTSMLRRDAIGFGGVDEHECYRGIVSGQFELVWRLVNSGVLEVWHEKVFIYHFHHQFANDRERTMDQRSPLSEDEEMHNSVGVSAFREGRLLPLEENAEIHRLRMAQRIIGSDFEQGYSK